MNTCKCTCENPTCSCAPQEVTAFKDATGRLHATTKDASVADIVRCVYERVRPTFDGYRTGVSNSDVEKVVKVLSELNLLKID